MQATLYYVHDPMCSWCWGFRPVWDRLQSGLKGEVAVKYVLGGLAPDTDQPMPHEMREAIRGYWQQISIQLGTQFNFDFWQLNTPRRSTYPACRAAIAASSQGFERQMIDAIQRAYYLRAQNPSDVDVLENLAREISEKDSCFSLTSFTSKMQSQSTQEELIRQITLARELTQDGFPALVLENQRGRFTITRDYDNHKAPLLQIRQLLGQAC